jgi:tryptophan-rich sensory protein
MIRCLYAIIICAAAILARPSAAFQVPRNCKLRQPSTRISNVQPPLLPIHTVPIQATRTKILSIASDGEATQSPPVDYDALLKYHTAVAVQMSLFALGLTALDTLVAATGMAIPFPVAAALFYGLSLKSRVLNPLNNARPNAPKSVDGDSSPGFRDRVMPSWTPPGIIFPIMWILIIGPLRAYSSALVVSDAGHFFSIPTMAFLLHLSVGDVWNTINNTEKRYGASVTGVLSVVASLLNAAYQYYTVEPLAGKLLGLTVVWLSVATSLITATWQLNPDPATGERNALYPVKGEADTEFIWFQNADTQSNKNDLL